MYKLLLHDNDVPLENSPLFKFFYWLPTRNEINNRIKWAQKIRILNDYQSVLQYLTTYPIKQSKEVEAVVYLYHTKEYGFDYNYSYLITQSFYPFPWSSRGTEQLGHTLDPKEYWTYICAAQIKYLISDTNQLLCMIKEDRYNKYKSSINLRFY